MSGSEQTISDQMFYAFVHPYHKRRFYLALIFSTMLFPLIAIGLIAGTIFLIAPAVAFLLWLSFRVFFAALVGNTVQVSTINYPRIHKLSEEMKVKIGFEKSINIFVYENSSFNAFMAYLFFRRAIFLNSELLENGVSDNEVRWIVGRFIGYMRARRQAGIPGWIIRAARVLTLFNVFILPYERSMVYTGDRLALAAIDGDITSAISTMQKILVGRELGYSINPQGIIDQQRQLRRSVFAFLARVFESFPNTVSRYVNLIVFAKIFFPAQFATFESANPELPTDIFQLALPPESNSSSDKTSSSAPAGWTCFIATLVVVLLVYWISWQHGTSFYNSRSVSVESKPTMDEPTPTDATAPAPQHTVSSYASSCANAGACVGEMLDAAAPAQPEIMEAAAKRLMSFDTTQEGDGPTAVDLNAQGLSKFSEGDYQAASRLFLQASQANPHEVETRVNLAYAYVRLGKGTEAINALLEALTIDPKHSSAWAALAEAADDPAQPNLSYKALLLSYEFSEDRQKTLQFISERSAKEGMTNSLQTAYEHALKTLESQK